MTGMERVNTVLSGQTPDQVPTFVNLLEQGARELGILPREYYAKGEFVAEGQLRLREKYGYDSLLGFFYSALDAEIMGCKNIVYADDGPPNVGHLVIRQAGDIEKLQTHENLPGHPRFKELAICINQLKRESAGSWPVLGVVTASFSLPAMLLGVGQWLDLLLSGEQSLRNLLLEKCSKFASRKILALREAGADFIVYNNPLASASFLTPQKSRELALPWVIRDLEEPGPSDLIFFNGGGKINPILADMMAHSGIGAYYLNPYDDIAEARQILGPGPLIVGSINDIRLLDWTSEEIDQEVEKIITAGKQVGGFLFGTLLMPLNIPEENIRSLMDAARKYGSYQSGGI